MGIIKRVQQIGSGRNTDNLDRRLMKAGEEYGELLEAHLNATSAANPKNKNHMDMVEEAVDLAIMALDIALTKPEDWLMSDDEWRAGVKAMFTVKMDKWEKQVEDGTTVLSTSVLDHAISRPDLGYRNHVGLCK
jgi:hypothetical protein